MKPLTSDTIFGNWATLLLATDKDGRIDMTKMSDEIDTLIAASPNGIYSNGTACEFYSQSQEEFEAISLLLSEKCEKAGIPYQIGASHPCAQESLRRLKAAVKLKPGAVQVILPDWFPVSDDAAISFLKVIEENAEGVPLVLYNPPHAKRVLQPEIWQKLKSQVPSLIGVKVFDCNRSDEWYGKMRENNTGLSVFVPGHHLATGIRNGASGAYSNVSCLNPEAAQKWYGQMKSDPDGALELENRICAFFAECIDPFIAASYPNHACDRFMALVGDWCDIGTGMRWPYQPIPAENVPHVRKRAHDYIPEMI